MPAGRPSKYDPVFCEQVIASCEEGKSLTAFAAEIGVSRATINNWMDEYPEFLEAVGIGKAKIAAWWESQGREVAQKGGAPGQSTLIVFGMKNMGADDWADVVKTEVTGKDGGPIRHTREMTDDELTIIAAAGSTRTPPAQEG